MNESLHGYCAARCTGLVRHAAPVLFGTLRRTTWHLGTAGRIPLDPQVSSQTDSDRARLTEITNDICSGIIYTGRVLPERFKLILLGDTRYRTTSPLPTGPPPRR